MTRAQPTAASAPQAQHPVAEPRPRVSVVVACYNAEGFLRPTLDSILANRSPTLTMEVIVVNDASTDRTHEILDSYGEQIRVIHAERNQGTCRSRNAGIAAVRGELIAFCDHDDLWEPNKLALQIPLFDDPEVALVCANSDAVEDGEQRPLYGTDYTWPADGRVFGILMESNWVVFSSAVVRRSVLDQVGVFDPDLFPGEDIDLWLRIAQRWKVSRAEPVLVHYRLMPSQFSRNKIAMRAARITVIERYGPLLEDRSEYHRILALYLFRFGEAYVQLGQANLARRKFWDAFRLCPTSPRYLFWLLFTMLPVSVTNGLRALRRSAHLAAQSLGPRA